MQIVITISLSLILSTAFAQQRSYFDPAQAYNRLLIEKGNGTYRQVSNYKVTGTSFLYGEKNTGRIYAPAEAANDIPLTYDTYTQHVEFYPSGTKVLTKEPGTLDSFVIRKNPETMLEDDITFVYGSVLGSKDKAYYMIMSKGPKVSLYKKYTATLGLVSTNIVQADLRQFEINVDYYYTDSTGKELKKLKVSSKNLAKEFSPIKNDLASIINEDDLMANRDNELKRLFAEMNK